MTQSSAAAWGLGALVWKSAYADRTPPGQRLTCGNASLLLLIPVVPRYAPPDVARVWHSAQLTVVGSALPRCGTGEEE